jgi:lipopolysaccharide/colanic/teichoic acid biosynthesis glycosyltransferase
LAAIGLPRWVEAAAAAAGLVITSPFLLTAAILVRATSRGPAFFRQERVGLGGRSFTLIKLRTMRAEAPGTAVTAGGDARVTPLGRCLRRTKLDELPELWHVVTGEMALVGPRPEVPSMVDLSNPLWRDVLAVRPGITDPVTLALRNEEGLLAEALGRLGEVESFYRRCLQPWKLKRYVEYQEGRTAWSDVRVLWKTILSVAAGAAADAPSLEEITNTGPSSDRPGPERRAP